MKYEELKQTLLELERGVAPTTSASSSNSERGISSQVNVLPKVQALFDEADVQSSLTALELVCKLLSNIVKYPTDDKYRRVRKENPKIYQQLTRWNAGMALLIECGFKDDGDVLWYLDEKVSDGSVQRALADVQGFITSIQKPSVTTTSPSIIRPKEYEELKMHSSTMEMQQRLDALRREMSAAMGAPHIENRGLCAFSVNNVPPILPSSEGTTTTTENIVAAAAAEQERERKKREQFQTKAMREEERLRKLKVYKETIIRVKFSDGNILQGIFHPLETVGTIMNVIQASLDEAMPALKSPILFTTPPKIVYDCEKTLQDSELVPAATLLFRDENLDRAIHALGKPCLKRELFSNPVALVMPSAVKRGLGGGLQDSSSRVQPPVTSTSKPASTTDDRVKAKMHKFFKF